MDDPGPVIIKLLVLLLLIIVNAFFAMSEIAIISLNDNKVRKMAEDGDKKAQRVLKLVESPSAFLSTIQIGVTLAGFLTSASAAGNFSEPLANLLAGWLGVANNGSIMGVLNGVSLVVVTVIISYFSLVLGELAPKRIGMQKSEAISFKVIGILLFIKKIMRPFIWFLSVSTNLVVRLLGFDPNASEEEVTEEEILMMVDAGEEKGVIEESQKEMINNIFEFDDIVAADVMTHRTDIAAVEISDPIAEVIEKAIEEGYSRIPVFEDDLDNICGIIYVKDLLKYVGGTVKGVKVADIMRKAIFVPESKKCRDLFNEMTEKRLQMVIVSDEYGGTAGLVTVEDLLEKIVGNMQDEYDDEEEEMTIVDDSTFTVDGVADLDEVEELLGIKFPEGEYDTLAGFIMSELGYIPEEESTPEIEALGYSFRVCEVEERRIGRVEVKRLSESGNDSDE